MSQNGLRPLGDRILIEPYPAEEILKSGLIIPETAQEIPHKGRVMAIGNGLLTQDGVRHPVEIEVGEEVIYTRYGGTELKLDGRDLVVLREPDVLAVIEG